jgi:geranylgeranylglycerol-phosphate geranylgeranyltransferase
MRGWLINYTKRAEPFLEILKLKGSTIDISIVLAVSAFVGEIDSKVLWIMLAGIFVHSGCDVINDIYDREIDKICKPKAPIPSGRMSVKTARIYMVALFSISLGIAFSLGKIIFLSFVLGIILGGIGYSHPRFRFKDIPVVATAITAFGFTLEAFGAWSVYARISREALEFSAYIFLLTFSLVLLKDFRDVKGDINSLPIMLGVRNAARVCGIVLLTPLIILLAAFLKHGLVELLFASMVLLIAIIPIEYILLYKDPVSSGSRLKDTMFVAITAPNIAMFFARFTL